MDMSSQGPGADAPGAANEVEGQGSGAEDGSVAAGQGWDAARASGDGEAALGRPRLGRFGSSDLHVRKSLFRR